MARGEGQTEVDEESVQGASSESSRSEPVNPEASPPDAPPSPGGDPDRGAAETGRQDPPASRIGTLGREWRETVQEEVPPPEDPPEDDSPPEDPRPVEATDGKNAEDNVPAEREPRAREPVQRAQPPRPRENGASGRPVQVPPAEEASDDSRFGERAELGRALALLDELVELDPENPDLYRRKAEYARRLEDTQTMARTFREWAEVLEAKGEWRGAHYLYHRSLELEPGDREVREALGRIVFQENASTSSGERSALSSGPATESEETSSLDWSDPDAVLRAELGRATEEVYRLQGAALRLLEARQGSRDEVDARQKACEILGSYYVARQAYGRAARVLLPILTRTGIWDEDRKDTLYLCGFAFLNLDEKERARECLERLAKVDDAFSEVLRSSAASPADSGEA